ncbi:ribonuclease PH [soil metagenome]
MSRPDGRAADELRPHSFERDCTAYAPGSVLVTFGETKVLCTAMLDEDVPRWMRNSGKGWVTAEYSMLPASSPERIRRETKGPKGRTQEIQRLIGRALRSITDMKALGERQILIDCDVLQADGGTRTAAISGAYLALHDCLTRMVQANLISSVPLLDELAAISVGVVKGEAVLDLPYIEDSTAETDMNVVMTGKGLFVEVQGTAEGAPFSREELDSLLGLAEGGIREIHALQREYLSVPPSPRTFGR